MLAGGRSSRFGRDKLAATYRGMPLLHHAVARLGDVCGEVVVVLAPGAAAPEPPAGVAVRLARDEEEGQGPLAGAAAGLRAANSELALVVGGDMPDLQVRVLLEMVRTLADSSATAVVLHDGDRPRPLPLAVRRAEGLAVAERLLEAGRRRLRDLLEELPVEIVGAAVWAELDPERRSLVDVDVPGDLEG